MFLLLLIVAFVNVQGAPQKKLVVSGGQNRDLCSPLTAYARAKNALHSLASGDDAPYRALFGVNQKFVNGFCVDLTTEQLLSLPAGATVERKVTFVVPNYSNRYMIAAMILNQVTYASGDKQQWFENHQFWFNKRTCLVFQDDIATDINLLDRHLNTVGVSLPAEVFGFFGKKATDDVWYIPESNRLPGFANLYRSQQGQTTNRRCRPYDLVHDAVVNFSRNDLTAFFSLFPENPEAMRYYLNGHYLSFVYPPGFGTVLLATNATTTSQISFIAEDPDNPYIIHYLDFLRTTPSTPGSPLPEGCPCLQTGYIPFFKVDTLTFDPETCKVVKDDVHTDLLYGEYQLFDFLGFPRLPDEITNTLGENDFPGPSKK